MTTDNFLPKGYKLPSTAGNFLNKFEKGNTKIRILSVPLLGWVDWKDEDGKKTPVRFAFENKPETSFRSDRPVKHFWAFKIWNYELEKVQVMDITQATIQGAIQTLVESEDWGSPLDYDITIKREGDTMENTKYAITPAPPKPLEEDIKVQADSVKISLSGLLAGLDPFGTDIVEEKEVDAIAEKTEETETDPF